MGATEEMDETVEMKFGLVSLEAQVLQPHFYLSRDHSPVMSPTFVSRETILRHPMAEMIKLGTTEEMDETVEMVFGLVPLEPQVLQLHFCLPRDLSRHFCDT
ncbi:hypothetical protein JTE90_002708 [Oedothorax gibbosus]|uniref:Uncharacterized protein n=1 Tax=Oedothorax gibbosus TaxID=931172 RepID=A0AAV6VZC8_9ARAC|nr:hypothetical protein JTE90_002708 [Oedothorax gibbosus]